jgi:hypothetical protein
VALFFARVIRTSTLLIKANSAEEVKEALTAESGPLDLLDITDYDLDVELEITEEVEDPSCELHPDGFVFEGTFFFADAPVSDEVEAGYAAEVLREREEKKRLN